MCVSFGIDCSADPADLPTVWSLSGLQNRPIGGVVRGRGSWVPSLRLLRSAKSANRPISGAMGMGRKGLGLVDGATLPTYLYV